MAGIFLLGGTVRGVTFNVGGDLPATKPVNEGGTLVLSVNATPTPPATGLLYQWYFNGNIISGAKTASLSIANVKSTNAGTYYVAVQDYPGSSLPKDSTKCAVTVELKPRITLQPKSGTWNQGDTVTLIFAYTGSTNGESFQWQKYNLSAKTWTNVATTATLPLGAVTFTDGGKYRVIVTTTVGSATSSEATLKINTVPVITQQPTVPSVLRAIARKGTTSLKVVATGKPILKYQWQFAPAAAPTNFANIDKATAASLTVKGDEANEGKYRVVIHNDLNTTLAIPDAVSAEVDVVVDDKVTIDAAGQPTAASAYTAGDDPVDLTVTPTGDPPFSFQWQKDGKNVAGPARFNAPTDAISDGAGGILVVDSRNHAIRQISAAGTVSTFAGALGVSGSDDDVGSNARFDLPNSIVSDGAGGFYISDTGNHAIRHMTAGGAVTTFAGMVGVSGFTDDTGILASFNGPTGLAVDSNGNLFVADTGNHVIRRITPVGVVSTFAGTAGVIGSKDGNGASAQFFAPMGLGTDNSDNLYVADSGNHCIRIITPAADVSLVTGLPGAPGKVDGALPLARFNTPTGVKVTAAGDILVADSKNHAIRKIAVGGVTTEAGKLSLAGSVDGLAGVARFNSPVGLAEVAAGNLCVLESVNHTVRLFSTSLKLVSTLGGSPLTPGGRDGESYANAATLKLGPIQWTDRGSYKCIIRNRVSSMTSKVVKVNVNSRPIFLTQPVDTFGATGGSAAFSVVVGGNTPITYQWFYFAVGQTILDAQPIKNAKAAKLSLTKLSAATHAGTYFCRATGKFPAANTSVDSAMATLTVGDAPKGTISLTANSNPKNIIGKVPFLGSFELTAATTAGAGTFHYQWQLAGKNFGSETTDNVLVVNPALTTCTGAWTCLIKTEFGTLKSNSVSVQVVIPPAVTDDPQPVGAIAEDKVTFTVKASGTGPLTYQWFEDGAPLPGKTTASLTLPSVTTLMDGRAYSCKVSNSVADATSASALLSVGAAPIPVFLYAYPSQAHVGDKVRIVGTGLAYTKSVQFGTVGASFITEPDGSVLATVPKFTVFNPSSGAGATVNIHVITRGGDSAGTTMNFTPYATNVFTNDLRANSTILTGQTTNVLADNKKFAGGDGGPFFPTSPPIENYGTAWYVWTVPQDGHYTLYARSQESKDITLALYDRDYAPGAPTVFPIAYNDFVVVSGFFDFTQCYVEVDATAGTRYSLFVGGYTSSSLGTYNLQIFKGPPSLVGLSAGSAQTQGLNSGASVMGQGSWTGQGAPEAAMVEDAADGKTGQVVLGGVAASEGTVVWPELTAEERDGKKFFSVNLGFDMPGGATADQFNWTLYDQDLEPIGAIWFNNSDGSVQVSTAAGDVHGTPQMIADGGKYHLEMAWDVQSGTWQASIDGQPLTEALALPKGASFGGISAGWVPGAGDKAPASMTFSALEITTDE